jgi:hypothetical protein
MRQAWHIFKKDVRGLTYEIVVTLLLMAAYAAADSRSHLAQAAEPFWADILWIAVPLSWWMLTAAAIHFEAIPGDRQFWRTRPYSWKSLLAAKIGLLVVFICVPMAISDAIVLHVQGFPVLANAAGILWKSVLDFGALVLSGMLLASLTRGMAGFVMTGLMVAAAVIFDVGFLAGMDAEQSGWTLAASAMAVVPAAIIFQYARHRRIAFGLTICALLLPLAVVRLAGFFEQPAVAAVNGPALHVVVDDGSNRVFHARSGAQASAVMLAFPIRIPDLPEGLQARSKSLFVTLASTSGEWTGGVSESGMLLGDGEPRSYWMEITVPRDFYDRAAVEKLKFGIHVSADLVLYKDLQSTMVGEREVAVPGVGFCGIQWKLFHCRSALRHPSISGEAYDRAGQLFPNLRIAEGRSPFPAELGISPMIYYSRAVNESEVEVLTGEPVSHVRSMFELAPLRLGDYVSQQAN